MSLFIVVTSVPLRGTEELGRLLAEYPENRQLADNAWLIRSNQTTKQISHALFPRDENGATAKGHVVLRTDAWSGWNDRDLWEWLSARESS
jgi:hypothetical protein